MVVAQTAAMLLGSVLLTPIVWAGFARRRTTVSRFHRKWHGSMTRESGVSWDIRLMAPVTTNSAITVVTTRSGSSKMKRGLRRAGNCREASICVDHCWQSLRKPGRGTAWK
jgi:NADH:ubiquinone oxidoreductase subunit D